MTLKLPSSPRGKGTVSVTHSTAFRGKHPLPLRGECVCAGAGYGTSPRGVFWKCSAGIFQTFKNLLNTGISVFGACAWNLD